MTFKSNLMRCYKTRTCLEWRKDTEHPSYISRDICTAFCKFAIIYIRRKLREDRRGRSMVSTEAQSIHMSLSFFSLLLEFVSLHFEEFSIVKITGYKGLYRAREVHGCQDILHLWKTLLADKLIQIACNLSWILGWISYTCICLGLLQHSQHLRRSRDTIARDRQSVWLQLEGPFEHCPPLHRSLAVSSRPLQRTYGLDKVHMILWPRSDICNLK